MSKIFSRVGRRGRKIQKTCCGVSKFEGLQIGENYIKSREILKLDASVNFFFSNFQLKNNVSPIKRFNIRFNTNYDSERPLKPFNLISSA